MVEWLVENWRDEWSIGGHEDWRGEWLRFRWWRWRKLMGGGITRCSRIMSYHKWMMKVRRQRYWVHR